jgi:hypothetical protein
MVLEDDRDIHLLINRPGHPFHRMIAELPNVHCQGAAGSFKRLAMHRARKHLVAACGAPSTSFRTLHGIARIKGVAFFDIPHGQSGHAPNYIELHPVLDFRVLDRTTGCPGTPP